MIVQPRSNLLAFINPQGVFVGHARQLLRPGCPCAMHRTVWTTPGTVPLEPLELLPGWMVIFAVYDASTKMGTENRLGTIGALCCTGLKCTKKGNCWQIAHIPRVWKHEPSICSIHFKRKPFPPIHPQLMAGAPSEHCAEHRCHPAACFALRYQKSWTPRIFRRVFFCRKNLAKSKTIWGFEDLKHRR